MNPPMKDDVGPVEARAVENNAPDRPPIAANSA